MAAPRAAPSELRAREKVPVHIFDDSSYASSAVAAEIAAYVRETGRTGQPCVLGLATGSTPLSIYRELVALHRQEGLSFAHVTTFNLDEYHPMPPDALQSYHRFMREHLFAHIDIKPENTHLPSGTVPPADLQRHCEEYEAKIKAAGGIGLQLLGIGRTGHVGFNERGSSAASVTRRVTLDAVTRVDAASDFFGEANVPRTAITMGLATILAAKRILLVAFGESKAQIAARAVEGPVSEECAASFLQRHPNAAMYLDAAAAAGLTRVASPWVLGSCDWSPARVRQAAVWLAQRTGKALLRLTDADYGEHSLQELLAERGPAHALNLQVFQYLQATITGWPGGRPAAADAAQQQQAPAEAAPSSMGSDSVTSEGEPPGGPRNPTFPKRVLIMSPHPDDDVISCGGTFIRLVEQGHEVHVAYQTSGCIAVWDEDCRRYTDFARQLSQQLGGGDSKLRAACDAVEAALSAKAPGEVDGPEVQTVKSLVRCCEARSAARAAGLSPERTHFLDLPFYRTGAVEKKPLSGADVAIVARLFRQLRPHQVFAAGDLSDPHGTHRTCLQAIMLAIEQVRAEPWFAGCEVWLYRGAWQEFEAHEIQMAVPLSPAQLQRKIRAIWQHESQKDPPLFPGADAREFWQRARDRNKATARLFDQLGLPEYEAMEAFVRYDPLQASPFFSGRGLEG